MARESLAERAEPSSSPCPSSAAVALRRDVQSRARPHPPSIHPRKRPSSSRGERESLLLGTEGEEKGGGDCNPREGKRERERARDIVSGAGALKKPRLARILLDAPRVEAMALQRQRNGARREREREREKEREGERGRTLVIYVR
jgi:hypothetical protein